MPTPADRKTEKPVKQSRRKHNSYKPKRVGRPTAYKPKTAQEICALIAQGKSLTAACETLQIEERTVYRWMFANPDFRQDLYRARELRGDWAFGEEIIRIADNTADDWRYNPESGRLSVNKEAMLRSKIRIEARQFHMSRLHPQQWGDRQQIDVKNDWSLLSEDERRRKAEELIAMIEEIRNPPPGPPPLEYRWQEPDEDDDQQPRGIGWAPRSVTGREG